LDHFLSDAILSVDKRLTFKENVIKGNVDLLKLNENIQSDNDKLSRLNNE